MLPARLGAQQENTKKEWLSNSQGTWLVSEKIQKKTKRKQRLSLELGPTKPIDHTWARMVSRLAEIQAEVMCCMSTTADTLNHQDPLFQGHGSQLTANELHPYWPGFY